MALAWSDRTWYGRKVKEGEGRISNLRQEIPCFTKVPLRVEGAGENRYFDLIVREPLKENKDKILPEDDEVQIPVATVSKQYNLIQHHEVLNALVAAVQESGLDPERLKAELTLTEYGELMRFSFTLPNYDFNPGDGHPIVLKVNALNSVDKTTSLDINLSWYRLVCSNGMMYSTGSARFRRIHLISRKPEDIRKFLSKQLGQVAMAQSLYKKWYQRVVYLKELSEAKPSPGQIELWIDETIAKKWGVHAAARAYHISKTGYDGELVNPFEQDIEPHKREVQSTTLVPGSFTPVRNAFDVSQVLSWLASQRRTIQDQLERTMDIPCLMHALLRQKRPLTLSIE